MVERGRGEEEKKKVSLGSMARMSVTTAASLMKENLENKAPHISCAKKQQLHNGRPSLPVLLLFCVCPFQAIRSGKHCDISRPSYSNQKIKVPHFFPSCPFLVAVNAKLRLRGRGIFFSSLSSVEFKKLGAHLFGQNEI